jgi:hypothetical protein
LVDYLNLEILKEVSLSIREISESEVRELLRSSIYTSAIGHESTSLLLTQKLGMDINYNRAFVNLEEGDLAVVVQLQARLPEGVVLSVDELNAFPIKYYLVKVS